MPDPRTPDSDEMVEAAASVLEPYLSFLDEDKLDWLVRAALTAALAARPAKEECCRGLAPKWLCRCETEAAAARPAQEPVAWHIKWSETASWSYIEGQVKSWQGFEVQPLYAASLAQPGREELVEALKVFVNHYEEWMDEYPDNHRSTAYSRHTFGDLRRARRLIGGPDAS